MLLAAAAAAPCPAQSRVGELVPWCCAGITADCFWLLSRLRDAQVGHDVAAVLPLFFVERPAVVATASGVNERIPEKDMHRGKAAESTPVQRRRNCMMLRSSRSARRR